MVRRAYDAGGDAAERELVHGHDRCGRGVRDRRAETLIFHLIFHLISPQSLTVPSRLGERLGVRLNAGDGLATVVRQLAERLEREADRLLTAAYILTGLRLKAPSEVRQLFQGVSIAMRESVTYQAILEEGREEGEKTGSIRELHRMILRQCRVRFGEADETVRGQIEAIRDIETLEELTERLVIVSSWDELMA